MLIPSPDISVFVAAETVNMRKGCFSLAAMVQQEFELMIQLISLTLRANYYFVLIIRYFALLVIQSYLMSIDTIAISYRSTIAHIILQKIGETETRYELPNAELVCNLCHSSCHNCLSKNISRPSMFVKMVVALRLQQCQHNQYPKVFQDLDYSLRL